MEQIIENWMRPGLALALSFLVSLAAGKFLIPMLRRLKAGQEIREDGPAWHQSKAGTPTMGGIMFIAGSGLVTLVLGWKQMLGGQFIHLYLFLFALIFGLIGFVDDYRKVRQHQNEGLTARQKFLLQLAAAVVFLSLMRYEGLLTNRLWVPFLNGTWEIPWILYLLFAAFVIVGCVNAVNLTDGIDGLAASVTLVVMVFFTVSAGLCATGIAALFPAALAGGLAASFVYNHHPAKVFMGDTGSLFLGGAVAGLAYAMGRPEMLFFLGAVYIWEAATVVIQVTYFKITNGKRLFKMTPIHHAFEMRGWSEVKIDGGFSLIELAAVLLGLLFSFLYY